MNDVDVVAVDEDTLESVAAGSVGGWMLDRRDALDRRVFHVLVVFAHEDDRKPPYHGEIEGFVEGSDVGRAVAEEADGDLAGAPYLGRPCRPDRDRQMRPDDGIRAEGAMLDAREVHRPALTAHHPPGPAHQLGHEGPHRGAPGEHVVMPTIG